MLRSRILPAITLIALAACGGGGGTGPGGNNNGNNSGNAVSATVDGAAWSGDAIAVRAAGGLYTITATKIGGSSVNTIILTLYNIGATGTYPIGVVANMFGGSAVVSQVGTSGWAAPSNGEAGTINLTTLTDTRIAGTFSFTATPLSGSGASRTITNGRFDLPLTGSGTVAIADNLGSRFTGTFGGASFTAGSGSVSLTNNVLTIVANNGTRTVTISVANMTGPGTYALSATTPVRTVQTSGIPGNLTATWGSQVGGGSGSVVVTSVTSTRVQGTFTGTLQPLAGGATGSLAVTGTFNMGRLFPGT